MSRGVLFYYDYGSPASYLAWARLPALCERHGARLIYRPILVGGLFKITGNHSPITVPAKGAWFFDDIARHAAHFGVPYRKNPHFVVNTLAIMRGAIWAEREHCLEPYNRVMFEGCWATGQDLADPEVVRAALTAAGLDADAMAAAIRTDDVKQALIAATRQAADRGVFGVPTMIVGDALHFGQDRLDWVERALIGTVGA